VTAHTNKARRLNVKLMKTLEELEAAKELVVDLWMAASWLGPAELEDLHDRVKLLAEDILEERMKEYDDGS